MSLTEQIKSSDREFGDQSSPVTSPWDLPRARGILLLAGPKSRYTASVPGGALDRDVQHAESLVDACRMLILRKYDALVVLPNAIDPLDEMSLTVLRNLSGGASLLVLNDTPAFPAAIANAPASVEGKRHHADTMSYPGLGSTPDQLVVVGPIVGYRRSGMIMVHGKPLQVSPTQWRILWRLLEAPHHRQNSADLIETMRNPGFKNAPQTLRVHIHRLRRKLAELGAGGVLFSGRRGYWLHWEPLPESAHFPDK